MTPSLARVLDLAIAGALDDVRVALPARVVSYDEKKQRIDAQPLVHDGYEGPDGARKIERLPIVTDVPVMFQGAGGYSETFPLAKGDTVLLVFCSSSIARWKVKGGEVDPGDDRRHAMSDAVAYAGVRDFAHALTNVPTDAWCITVPTGKQIKLGSSGASEAAIKGDTYRAAEDTLMTAITVAIEALAAASPTLTGSPAQIAAWAAALTALASAKSGFDSAAATYLSAKVKVE